MTKFLYENWTKEELPFRLRHAVEVMHTYLRDGKIKLKPNFYPQSVTYHDPCQIGRNGAYYEEPRNSVKAAAADYREMTPTAPRPGAAGAAAGWWPTAPLTPSASRAAKRSWNRLKDRRLDRRHPL